MIHRLLFTTALVLTCLAGALGQNAIIGSGFSTGWNNSGNITYPFSSSAGSSRIATFPSNGSGNRFWRMIRGFTGAGCLDGNNTEYGPPGNTDTQISTFGNVQPHGYTNGNGAWFVNDNTTGHNFIFKTENPCSSNRWTLFRVQGAVSTITSQSVSSGTVYPGENLTFNAALNAVAPTGQGVYLRYSTDNFSSSVVVPMSFSSGTSYTATINGVSAGATYTYYYFTSGSGLTIAPADADFYTINLLNNSNANYTKTIESAWVTTNGSGVWQFADAWAGGRVPVAGQPVVINHNIQLSGPVNTGNITVNAGTFLAGHNVTLVAGARVTVAGGTYTQQAGTLDATSAGCGIRLNSGSFTMTGSNVNVGSGNFEMNGGTLQSGIATFNMSAGSAFINNGGTVMFAGNTINCLGTCTIGGSTSTPLGDLILNTGTVTLATSPSLSGTLTINGGNLDANARINYQSGSTVLYNTSYTVFREWLSTSLGAPAIDRPQNITVANGATLTLPSEARAMGGTLTICSTCSLTFQTNSTLAVRNSWTNNHTGENITYVSDNNRVIFGDGTGTTNVTKAGTAAQVFRSLEVAKGFSINLNSDVNITGTSGDVLVASVASSGINLNGKILTFSGNGGNLAINSTCTVTSSAVAAFNINGSKTRTGSGNLFFTGTTSINIASGNTFTINASGTTTTMSTSSIGNLSGNWNTTAGTVTINGILNLNGGSYSGTSPTYGTVSTLRYSASTTVGTEMSSTSAGTAGSGRPNNVDIANGSTLTLADATRALANDLVICTTCNVTFQGLSRLIVGRDWVNNNSSTNITYVSDNNEVSFINGSSTSASITKAGGATEVFRKLIISKSAQLVLNSPVNVTATTGNALAFTPSATTVNLNGYTLTLTGAGGNLSNSAQVTLNGSVGSKLVLEGNRTVTGAGGVNISFGGSVGVELPSGTLTLGTNAIFAFGLSNVLRLSGGTINLPTSSSLTMSGTVEMASSAGGVTGAPLVYFGFSKLIYNAARTVSSTTMEWNVSSDGLAASGRPHNVEINDIVTFNAAGRALAGNLTIGTSGALTGQTSSTLINLRGTYTDNNTSTSNITRIGLSFNTSTTTNLTKSGSGALSLTSLAQTGAGMLVLNNNLNINLVSGATSSLSFGTGGLNIGSYTVSTVPSITLNTGTLGITGSTGILNFGASATAAGIEHKFENVTVNINAGVFYTPASGMTLTGTAALNVNVSGNLQLNGPYNGPVPTYSTNGSLIYGANLTIGNEWTATTSGPTGTGRPFGVSITSIVNTTATTRAVAGGLNVSGQLIMGANPTLYVAAYNELAVAAQGLPLDATLIFDNNAFWGGLYNSTANLLTFKNLELRGVMNVEVANPVYITGNVILAGTGNLYLSDELNLIGTGTINVTNTGTITSPVGYTLNISGQYTVPASNTQPLVLDGQMVVNIPAGGSLTMSDAVMFNTTGAVTVAGSMTSDLASITYPADFTVSGKFNLNYNGGAAPTATWGSTGHLVVQGVTNTVPTNLNQSFGSFTWASPSQAQDLILGTNSPTLVANTFNVRHTNNYRLFLNTSRTYSGGLVVNGGRLALNNTVTPVTVNVSNLIVDNSTGSGAQLLIGQDGGSATLSCNDLSVNLSAHSLPVELNNRVIDFANSGDHTITCRSFTQTGSGTGLMGGAHNLSGNTLLRLVAGGSGVVSLDKPAFIDQVYQFEIAAPVNFLKPLGGTLELLINAPAVFEPGAYIDINGPLYVNYLDITHSDPDGVNAGSTGLLRSTISKFYQPNGSITYNGTTLGSLGDDFNALSVRDLTINNTAGVGLSASSLLPQNTILNAPLIIGNNVLTLNDLSDFTINPGGGLTMADNSFLLFQKPADYTLPDNLFLNTSLGGLVLNGAGTITLNNQNLTIQGLVTLANGKLRVPANKTLSFDPVSNWPTETSNNYIIGTTVMQPRAVGTGALDFMDVTLAAGTDNLGNVSITRTTGPDARVTLSSATGIDCNWIIEADNQPVSGRSMTLKWSSLWDNGNNMSAVRFWRRISSGDPWLPMGSLQNVSATNPRSLTFTTNHFSDWTVFDNSIVLPVTFVSVNAQRQGASPVVQVSYTTAEERNVANYTLERSANTKEWESVSIQQARTGTSNKYQMTDLNSAVDATWYYRVKSTDLDGTTGFSPVVVVRPSKDTQPEVALYPNPVKDVLLLNVSGMDEGAMQITITNAEGRAVFSRGLEVLAGTNHLRLQDQELSSLPAGMYMVQLALPNGTVLNKKMVK